MGAAAPRSGQQGGLRRRFWYFYYFLTERGRAGLTANRREIARVIWARNSPAWHFLAQNGFRVVGHDRRGHGRSSQTSTGNDMDGYADDLAAVIEALDLTAATLVGHSTGGGEVARYIGRPGTRRVAKAALRSPGLLPGQLARDAVGELSADDERGPAQWTLDTLAETAGEAGIAAGRSQVRRVLLAEKVRWRRTRSRATSTDPEFVPKGPASWSSAPPRRPVPR